jgi:bidirectional [NiFe] hydrogenase diaphorase subunit
MSVSTITIDDQVCSAKEGQTILQVATDNHIRIPTLCDFPGIGSIGACRLCLVQINESPRLQPSCVVKVEEGMRVVTNNERLHSYRKMLIELLLAERNHVCSSCVMNTHCELQSLAAELGVDHVRYEYLYPNLGVDASHKRFVIDHNRCVLCTRCVRVCDEIEGAHVWDVGKRGINSRIVSELNRRWGDATTCTSCGKCVNICPTGALSLKGATVAEMVKEKQLLRYLMTARKTGLWDLNVLKPTEAEAR